MTKRDGLGKRATQAGNRETKRRRERQLGNRDEETMKTDEEMTGDSWKCRRPDGETLQNTERQTDGRKQTDT